MKYVTLNCHYCDKEFTRVAKQHKYAVKTTTTWFCSQVCGASYRAQKNRDGYVIPDKKKCTMCGIVKPMTDFGLKNCVKDGRQSGCKTCRNIEANKVYKENPEPHKARVALINKKIRKRNQDFVIAYLSNHPCVDCGETDPVILEFDHVLPGKLATISKLVDKCNSILKLQLEIEKCEVRCANCHRRKTARDFSWYKHTKQNIEL